MSEITLINDRYKVEDTLGTGGMAVVYKARDLTLERNVAIKVLRQKYSTDPAFREHFVSISIKKRKPPPIFPTPILSQSMILDLMPRDYSSSWNMFPAQI